ncbi:MAG: hypothetical protein EP332_10625 [Bacteroidetes bacterium]|nr:MAG: hypothetical protein EP332_10625 [Bacteroidota bacterium]
MKDTLKSSNGIDTFELQSIKAVRVTQDQYNVTFVGSDNGAGTNPVTLASMYDPAQHVCLWNLGTINPVDLYKNNPIQIDFAPYNTAPLNGSMPEIEVEATAEEPNVKKKKGGVTIGNSNVPPPTSVVPTVSNQQICADISIEELEMKSAGQNLQIKVTYQVEGTSYNYKNNTYTPLAEEYDLLSLNFEPDPQSAPPNGPVTQNITIPYTPGQKIIITFMESGKTGIPDTKKALFYLEC